MWNHLIFIINRGGRHILLNFQGEIEAWVWAQSHKAGRVAEATSKPRVALLGATLPSLHRLCLQGFRLPRGRGRPAGATLPPSRECPSGCNWLLLPSLHLSAQVPSRSIFYLFNTFHCQGVCNLLPGTGWNRKQLLLLLPPAPCKSLPLWPELPPLSPVHRSPHQLVTFLPLDTLSTGRLLYELRASPPSAGFYIISWE